MSSRRPPARKRIGRVSVYTHHGSSWLYYRRAGKPVRRSVGENAALAECEASIVNFVAGPAGLAPMVFRLTGGCEIFRGSGR